MRPLLPVRSSSNALPEGRATLLREPAGRKVAANPVLAVVGATGAVGVEILRCLEQRNFPVKSLRLLASPRSVGRRLAFAGQEVPDDDPLTHHVRSEPMPTHSVFRTCSHGWILGSRQLPAAASSGGTGDLRHRPAVRRPQGPRLC